jgi:hypothetical protein
MKEEAIEYLNLRDGRDYMPYFEDDETFALSEKGLYNALQYYEKEIKKKQVETFMRLIVSLECAESGDPKSYIYLAEDIGGKEGERDAIIANYNASLYNFNHYTLKVDKDNLSVTKLLSGLVRENPQINDQLTIVTVTGIENLSTTVLSKKCDKRSELLQCYFYLQWGREKFLNYPFPVILWVKDLSQLMKKSPDFWHWNRGVFRF